LKTILQDLIVEEHQGSYNSGPLDIATLPSCSHL